MADDDDKAKVAISAVAKIDTQQLIENKDHRSEYIKIGKFIAESGKKAINLHSINGNLSR